MIGCYVTNAATHSNSYQLVTLNSDMWVGHWEVDGDGDVWVSILLICVGREQFVHVPLVLFVLLVLE